MTDIKNYLENREWRKDKSISKNSYTFLRNNDFETP